MITRNMYGVSGHRRPAVIVDEHNRHSTLAQTEGFGHIRSIYELKDWLATHAGFVQ